ncbi:LexA DNA binding domain-containing protein [Anaerovirgula multivorans]|uniref:LexA DNA binding domain-containing protein n=1 Tax=Anaerovirgula multivorans TaxID=312168 RepID=A0A239A781_9FIRM|nr:hypothetical protein [Anaerovirgula multivorans]SNR91292.1 LexA DNA binding domain-containing protein [Anaerovirgula multivorans]
MKYSQLDVVKAVEKFIKENGFSPTTREVCNFTNLNSTKRIHTYLNKLEELEIIKKRELFPRTIRITDKGKEMIKAYEIIGS